jgi:hypothetical protein
MKDSRARLLASAARIDAISRNNPFDAVKTKMAALQPVVVGIFGDSTTRDSSPNDGTPKRYPAAWQEDAVARGEFHAAYTVRRIVWDPTIAKPVWGSIPILQIGTGWAPNVVTGSVTGTAFTLSSGSVAIGQIIAGPGLPYGAYITSGSGSSWTISEAPSAAIGAGTTFWTYAYNAGPPLPWDLWQASVTGSIPNYFLGGLFGRALASIAFDALIFAHGINTASFYQATTPWNSQPTAYSKITGVMVAAIEQFRSVNPACPILMLTQHPLQTGTADQTGDASWRPAILQTASLLGCAVDDTVFAAYNAAGKPNGLYNGDGIHESTTTGVALYVAMLRNWWTSAVNRLPAPCRPSLFQTLAGAQNLLTNSAWEKWTTTTAAPDGWTATGSPTISQDTANFADPRKGYSAYVVAPAGSAAVHLQQVVPNVANLRGRTVTLAARAMVDTGGSNVDLARIGIIATSNAGGVLSFINHGATSTITQGNGFRWITLTVRLPEDLTALTIRLYSNVGATSDGTRGVRWDQACLVPGSLPMAARV